MRPAVDAVQMFSDMYAMRFLQGLHARGVRIPDDIAVVGFDDRPAAALAWPPLTTIRQPNDELGTAAATILLDKIAGRQPPETGWSITLPTRLVIRAST
jgi:LacI family transcriptional regulator